MMDPQSLVQRQSLLKEPQAAGTRWTLFACGYLSYGGTDRRVSGLGDERQGGLDRGDVVGGEVAGRRAWRAWGCRFHDRLVLDRRVILTALPGRPARDLFPGSERGVPDRQGFQDLRS